ncbi:MAG: YdiU family protein [Methylobacterium mesophilicum]|nr:YdiU family protein [Methylobacterium mesophilicum]
MTVHFPFDNSYSALPERFFRRTDPTRVVAPLLIKLNTALAEELGLDPKALASPEGVDVLAGNLVPADAFPLAAAYAGHQFGQFVPQLGDGRAILLGEVVDAHGRRRDIQLKGAGPTPFSRRGDGRAAIGPVLREYIVSEAMAVLGVPTTRALAAVATGEEVYRETALPGAVLTRVAASHIRVGTFQFFAARGDTEGVRALADHAMARHYPEVANEARPYPAFLSAVIAAQAKLVAQWMSLGFIHGVMNTDNCSIAGETIDYGPCAFMDAYHPSTVFSSIDAQGRYAYANQAPIALWNLARLAETFLPLFSDDLDAAVKEAETLLGAFKPAFEAALIARFRLKLGLATEREEDRLLVQGLLDAMAHADADFTLAFRRLADAAEGDEAPLRALFADPEPLEGWLGRWRERLALEPDENRAAAMRAANPFAIPRNHRVEDVIQAAQAGDLAPFETLLKVLAKPFEAQPGLEAYADPPALEERVLRTFCGT